MFLIIIGLLYSILTPSRDQTKNFFHKNIINTFYMNLFCDSLSVWLFLDDAPLHASHLPLQRVPKPAAQEPGESHTSHTHVQTHTHLL